MIYVIQSKYNVDEGFIDEVVHKYTTDIHLAVAFGNEALQSKANFLKNCSEDFAQEQRKKYHSVEIEVWSDDGKPMTDDGIKHGYWKYVMFKDYEQKQAHFYVFDNQIKIAPEECDQLTYKEERERGLR